MDNEIVQKIENIARGKLTESQVSHLFVLARKLIERIPKQNRSNFSLLKFYCDWTVHSEIDRSEAGAQVLERIHNIIYNHIKKKDDTNLLPELGAALSMSTVREQLNQLVNQYRTLNVYDKNQNLFSEIKWRELLPLWAEIVSHIPLRINRKYKYLRSILDAILRHPLKGTSVVDEIKIIRLPREAFPTSKIEHQQIFCFMITTTDTTHIIAPLML